MAFIGRIFNFLSISKSFRTVTSHEYSADGHLFAFANPKRSITKQSCGTSTIAQRKCLIPQICQEKSRKQSFHAVKHHNNITTKNLASSFATFESKEGGKDEIPPSNKAKKTTPNLQDEPALFECSTTQDAIKWWSQAFSERGVPEAEVSAEFIIAHVLGYKQLHEFSSENLQRSLTEDELNLVNSLCQKRLQRMPVQYIVGDWDFRDVTLIIRPPVFIPRPETEMLVDIILGHYSSEEQLHFLEVGCGSGAIAVSILNELPQAHVTALDCSDEAVQLTRENAARLGVNDRLTLHRATMTTTLPQCLHGGQGSYDAIVSNPPYIPNDDMHNLPPEIKLYEDPQALNGGPDGMDLIQDIIHNAKYLLKPEGCIWLETDTRHPEAITAWLETNQEMGVEFVRTFQDYNDRPRFSLLRYRPRPT